MGSTEPSASAKSAPADAAPLTWHPLVPRSIGGLMLLTLACAGLFAVHLYARDASLELEDIAATALLGFATLVAIGLLQQARDLWRYRREMADKPASSADTSTNPRHVRFQLALAVGLCVATAATLVLMTLGDAFADLIGLGEQSGFWGFLDIDASGWQHIALPYIWCVVALSFARQSQRVVRPRRWSWAINLTTATAIIAAFAILLYDAFLLHFLVFQAVRGIEFSASSVASPLLPDANQDILGRLSPAFWTTWWALIPGGLLPICIRLRARAATLRYQRVWLCTAALAVLAYGGLVGLNAFVLLPAGDPIMTSVSSKFTLSDIWLNSAPLVLLVSTVLALRLARQRPRAVGLGSHGSNSSSSRPATPVAWHERPFVLLSGSLCTFVAMGGIPSIRSFCKWLGDYYGQSWATIWAQAVEFLETYVYAVFAISPFAIEAKVISVGVALFLFCLILAWRGRRKRLANYPVHVPDVGAPRQFAVVWLLATAWVVITIPQLCLIGFMLHAAPWFL